MNSQSPWRRRILIAAGVASVGLLGLLGISFVITMINAVCMGFCGIGEQIVIPDARYCFMSESSMEQLISELDPVITRGGYPHKRYRVYGEWYSNELPTGNGGFGDNIEVYVSTKEPTFISNIPSRGAYRIILYEWRKRYAKGGEFTQEGWRRWADLKPLIEGGTGLILSVEKHPAVDTAPEDRQRFSHQLGIPVAAKDARCE